MQFVLSTIAVVLFAGGASASDQGIKALFPEAGLRYKHCQIKLNTTADGYTINIKRDCPSNYCYGGQLSASVAVNTHQIEVFGKTLTNYHKINTDNKTTLLEVKKYGKWLEETSIGIPLGGFGSPDRVLIGYYQTKLEMRINNSTGQVENFNAYSKGSVNWFKALQGGILTTARALHRRGSKFNLVDCSLPGVEMHKTLTYILEGAVSFYEVDKKLTSEERKTLEAKLLQLLPTVEKSELTDTSYFGNTPLHYAARIGLVNFARQLIPALPKEATNRYRQRLNPLNFQDTDGFTPLYLAVRYGEVAMVKLLIATDGVDPHIMDNWDNTPMKIATDKAKEHCADDATSPACTDAQEIVAIFNQS
ncbi:MAG: ankyrin repeat domain-containing protein [Pseudomonadota bacterium]|nr:ankyrin repeat domain-containing protein [Pseudomonadota bacterium]